MSHNALTTVPPPGPETKPVQLVGGGSGAEGFEMLAHLNQSLRRRGKRGGGKKKEKESCVDWTRVRSYEPGKVF